MPDMPDRPTMDLAPRDSVSDLASAKLAMVARSDARLRLQALVRDACRASRGQGAAWALGPDTRTSADLAAADQRALEAYAAVILAIEALP